VNRHRVPFLSLAPKGDTDDAAAVRAAVARVVASGWYVLGPEGEAFESEFAAASGAVYAVGTGTGTDAIALILRTLDIGAGDEVITTPLSAAFTALAVMMVGARPVFADIDPVRLTLDADQVARVITPRTRAILPVHLYGQAADMSAIQRVASRHGLPVVEDCCQAHLATAGGRPVGTIGVAGAFSFYPTKNLGALGDGGAVITNDRGIAERVRRLRNGGQSSRYAHTEPGINSRLDEMQAALLRARLTRLRSWTDERRTLAARYRALLAGARGIDAVPEQDAGHVYHLFVVRAVARSELRAHLTAAGIETLIHYPVPIPRQAALASTQPAPCPIADRVCNEVLSLPLHIGMSDEDLRSVADAVKSAPSAAAKHA
jgi:dTDP-4-amino-4,6-dideoxygalactose transaminase